MKSKLMAAVFVCGLVISAFAADEKVANGKQQLVRIKSGDSVVAEISIEKADKLIIRAKTTETFSKTNSSYTRMVAKGDVRLEIVKAGGSDVILTAQEIEIVPRQK
jgi:hypothetical protein